MCGGDSPQIPPIVAEWSKAHCTVEAELAGGFLHRTVSETGGVEDLFGSFGVARYDEAGESERESHEAVGGEGTGEGGEGTVGGGGGEGDSGDEGAGAWNVGSASPGDAGRREEEGGDEEKEEEVEREGGGGGKKEEEEDRRRDVGG